jgi:hypothetical protein
MLDDISYAVKSLKAGDATNSLNQLLVDYETMMLPHLEQEEAECLPLCRAYFTPAEVSVRGQEILKHEPKVALGSFISCMGVAKFRSQFMLRENIPWFVWYLHFRGCVKEFEARFTVPMQALVDGLQPIKAVKTEETKERGMDAEKESKRAKMKKALKKAAGKMEAMADKVADKVAEKKKSKSSTGSKDSKSSKGSVHSDGNDRASISDKSSDCGDLYFDGSDYSDDDFAYSDLEIDKDGGEDVNEGGSSDSSESDSESENTE